MNAYKCNKCHEYKDGEASINYDSKYRTLGEQSDGHLCPKCASLFLAWCKDANT